MSNSFVVRFNDEEVAERLTKLHIEALRKAAQLCDDVIEIVWQFEGKVLNVKFEKAIKEKTGQNVSVGYNGIMMHHYRDFNMDWWIDNRSVPGHGCCYSYINVNSLNICYMRDCTEDNSPIIDKRIIAANLVPAIKEQKERLLLEAGKIESGLEHISEWKQRAIDLSEQVNKLHDEIPYEIKDYYGLDIPWSAAY